MAAANLGSISDEIFNLIDGIPESISGGTLLGLIDRRRLFMEERTGQNIGSTAIGDKFQPALVNLSMASLMRFMDAFGVDAANVKIGDWSFGKGGGSNLQKSADKFDNMGMRDLNELGGRVKFYQVFQGFQR